MAASGDSAVAPIDVVNAPDLPGSGAGDLGTETLTWWEVADAVWLAAVTRGTRRASPAGEQPSPLADLPETAQEPPEPTTGEPPQPPSTAETPGEYGMSDPGLAAIGPGSRLASVSAELAQPSAEIIRALRPLKRKRPSRDESRVVLDEEATAERAVEDGLWWPVTKPEEDPWLHLTLVVDAAPSMTLWQPAVSSFVSLMRQLGTFDTVQCRLLDSHQPESGGPSTPVLRGGTPSAPSRAPAELLDHTGRRLLLVITDGASESWRGGHMSSMLACWGQRLPVAVIRLLPQRLWIRHGPPVHRARLNVPSALSPNARWGVELPDTWLEPEPVTALPPGTIAVPMLELGARWLRWWSDLVTRGRLAGPVDASVVLAGTQQTRAPKVNEFDELAGHEQVGHFHTIASPQAFHLATLLAAVPVSLPVARLVQAELAPGSGQDDLVEVFTSGLLRPPDEATGSSWETGTFYFSESVRAALLSGARRSDTARVVRVTADRFGDQIGGLSRLRDAIDNPDSTPDPVLTPECADEVAIERIVLKALSGPYAKRASRITGEQQKIQSGISSTPVHPSASTVSDSMRNRTDLATSPGDPTTGDSTLAKPPSASPGAAPDRVPPPTPATGTPGAKTAVPKVWGNVPPRNPNFTGRAELLELLDRRLNAGGTTAILPAALHGMGGIGKTQMAVEFIYRRIKHYDLVWWIQATQANQIRAGLTELAQHLGLPVAGEANTAVPAVREALRLGQPHARWLLVFDAAESPDVVRPFFPSNGPGDILVTSRNPDWAGVASPLEVTVFEREESIELLRRRGPDIDDEDAHRLADKLGDLPLAIEQAAAWRAETGMPVREYLRLFDDKVAEILDTSSPADYEVSVAAAWNVSFDELATRSPAAHQLLHVCAFFAPEPISRSLFTGVRGVSITPELDRALRDPMQLSRAIRDISRYGLAKIDHRTDTLLLHRLVQLVLRNRMNPQVRATMRHGAHQLLANLDPRAPTSSRQWPRYQEILPHVYAADLIECDDGWARELAINLMFFLYHFGDHEEALKLAKHAFETWAEQLGPEDTQTLQAADRYGYFLWELGRYPEASALRNRTLEIHRRISGEDREETLIAQIAVVVDLRTKGDFAGAKQLSQDILQRARGLFGDDDPVTLRAAHIHAISLRFMGEYKTALKLDEDTHRRRVEILGYENAETLNTYTALLLDRRESGDYAGARTEYERHAEHLRQLFGGDKAATLRVYSYLAVSRRKDGDHGPALDLSTRMLRQFRTRYGDGHPAVIGAALSHSMDVRQNGNLPEAKVLGEQAYDRYRALLGEQHPNTLAAMLDLAVTLRLLGDPASARQLDERVLEQYRTALGPDHPYSVTAAINLASDLSALGESAAAQELGVEAMDRAKRVLGSDHATTLAAALNLALDLRSLGRKQEAENRYADVLTGYRQVLGEAHPATMSAAKGVRADCDIDPLPF